MYMVITRDTQGMKFLYVQFENNPMHFIADSSDQIKAVIFNGHTLNELLCTRVNRFTA